jgi:nitroreductase
MRIRKCGFVFSAKMKVGRRWAAAEAPSLGHFSNWKKERSQMEFYEVIKKRRTIREYSSRPIEQEKLLRVLEAGLCAPTHNHLRQWEYVLVSDMAVRYAIVDIGEGLRDNVDIGELSKQFDDDEPSVKELYLKAIPLQKKMILMAPELLVICYKRSRPIKDCIAVYELNSFASVWCCIENILLAMTAEGLYGVTYIPQNTERIREILCIPDDYEIPVLLPLGYPSEDTKGIPQRPMSLNEKLHYNKF